MIRAAVAVSVILASIQSVAGVAENRAAERLEAAKMLVAQMAAGQFDKAVGPFDPTMKRALPAEKLKEVWEGLTTQFGPLRRAVETTTGKAAQYDIVFVTCEFERGKLDAKVVFTADAQVTGLFFVPSGRYKSPPYVDRAQFDEKDIQIGKGIWSLPGTLSLPKGDGPFPAVILVHGSGPNDRDESLGPNKPFRDLAHGLASRGIAVLRYEKRTKQHPVLMALSVNSITVKEETIDDAAGAFDALSSQPRIDPKRIFVLGHSLGGMLLPRIGKARQGLAGFISLAGSTRPLEDLVLEQTRYILSLEGKPTAAAEQQLKTLEQQAAKVKSPSLTVDTAKSELPLGAPASYWLDLRGYDPPTAAKELSQPMLILQGERDYQVTMLDFAAWKKALGSRKDVTFISYPRLNHLFIDGEGECTPAEYLTPGNVARVVIEDITRWVKSVKLFCAAACLSGSAMGAGGDWPMWRYDAGRTAASPLELPARLQLQWKREMAAPRPAFPHDPRLRFDVSYEPVAAGSLLFVPSMVSDSVTALDTRTGQVRWTFFADGPVRFAPVAWEGKVYFVSDDGCLHCVNAEEGRLLWKFQGLPAERMAYRFLGNERLISRWPARGGPVLADGTIYFAAGIWPCEGVFVYAVDARTGRQTWANRDGGLIKDSQLDHGDRRDGGLAPQGYLAAIGPRLVVPCGRALPAFFERKTGAMEPYTSGWGGRIALAKGCWYACGLGDYLFQSGDVYAWNQSVTPDRAASRPGDLVRVEDLARQMKVSQDTVTRWIQQFSLQTVTQEGKQLVRLQNPAPITYLSWWTQSKSTPARPGERHTLETRTRLQVDPANVKELGVFREFVLTAEAVYYSCPEHQDAKRITDEDRRAPGAVESTEIKACDLTRAPQWDAVCQGGWGGRLVEWQVADLAPLWSIPSKLHLHIKAGPRLYTGGPGLVAAIDIPKPGQQPKISWQTSIDGTPARMLAADDRLFVVTKEGSLYCFGAEQTQPKTYAVEQGRGAPQSDQWTAKAADILKQSGVSDGYCLALGLGTGRLVEELVSQSKLDIIVLEPDAKQVDVSRRKLHAKGLYGSRVHVIPAAWTSLRLPPLLASLVVAEDLQEATFKSSSAATERLFGSLRPYGGTACLPLSPERHAAFAPRVNEAKLAGAQVKRHGDWTLLIRAGALPDSADWTHENGDAAGTFASQDRGARPPFAVLWFGGGVDRVIPCLQGPAPRIAGGRMFLRVGNDLHAADIYTGRHLWQRTMRGFGEFVAVEDALYVVSGKVCLRLDPATGATAAEIPVPLGSPPGKGPGWQQIRIRDKFLVGAAGEQLVCADRHTGALLWKVPCKRDTFGIAVGNDKVFCVDYWAAARRRRGEPGTEEATISAVDLVSGKILWQQTANTPAEEAAKSGDLPSTLNPQLAFCEPKDVLVFSRHRSTAGGYRGATGELLWSKDLPCKDPPRSYTSAQPPIVLAGLLITHGGEVIDPSTGETAGKRMWKGMNPELRGCGRALGSPCLITVRDSNASYFDLASGEHIYFRGIRAGCTNNFLPAGGILNAPNFARQCTCNWPLSVSLGLVTMPDAAAWDPARRTARP